MLLLLFDLLFIVYPPLYRNRYQQHPNPTQYSITSTVTLFYYIIVFILSHQKAFVKGYLFNFQKLYPIQAIISFLIRHQYIYLTCNMTI